MKIPKKVLFANVIVAVGLSIGFLSAVYAAEPLVLKFENHEALVLQGKKERLRVALQPGKGVKAQLAGQCLLIQRNIREGEAYSHSVERAELYSLDGRKHIYADEGIKKGGLLNDLLESPTQRWAVIMEAPEEGSTTIAGYYFVSPDCALRYVAFGSGIYWEYAEEHPKFEEGDYLLLSKFESIDENRPDTPIPLNIKMKITSDGSLVRTNGL